MKRALLASLVLVGAARAQEAPAPIPALWFDHAVANADHVARGSYDAGKLTVARELKGSLGARVVEVDRLDVEVPEDQLAPGSGRGSGDGVFFLLARFEGRESRRRFIGWNGPTGVAWIRSGLAYAYRPFGEEQLVLEAVGPERDVLDAVAASLAREAALRDAVATTGSAARAEKLAAIVRSAREGPGWVERDLGPDPFAARALVELPPCGEAAVAPLESMRAAGAPWLRAAAVRALSATAESPVVRARRIEAIACDATASDEEVVAAVEALFHLDEARLEVLTALAKDPRAAVRRSVAAALREKATDPSAFDALLRDEDAGVRAAAAEAARAAARRLGLKETR